MTDADIHTDVHTGLDAGHPEPFRFDEATVTGVIAHMNADHSDDTLLICRALGNIDRASAATMSGLDGDGGDYVATVDGTDQPVRIPWSRPLTERAEIRVEVVRMYEAACTQLGLTPRGH